MSKREAQPSTGWYLVSCASLRPAVGPWQSTALQSTLLEVEQKGQAALKDARATLAEVQAALLCSKEHLASLLRDYQARLGAKLALDVEMATYHRLPEGEESMEVKECVGDTEVKEWARVHQ